jgi:hypothetical protein
LRRHFDMANGDLEKLGTSADRIVKRGERIESVELEDAKVELPVAAARPRLINLG